MKQVPKTIIWCYTTTTEQIKMWGKKKKDLPQTVQRGKVMMI